ncbi:MAG TPA: TIGR03546 family protein [Pseudomonadales bacterium]
MIKQLVKFLRLLGSDVAPWQIAGGLCLGLFMAFTPLMSLHNLLVLLLVCLLRINVTAMLLGLALCTPLAYLLDPAFIRLGEYVLTHPQWQGLWTAMYQQDIWRLAHFNNTLTMGSFLASCALLLPAFLLFRWLVIRYRQQFLQYINRLGVVRWLKASKQVQMLAGIAGRMEGH